MKRELENLEYFPSDEILRFVDRNGYSKDQLSQVMKNVIDFCILPKFEKEEYSLINMFDGVFSKEDLLKSFYNSIVIWYAYLSIYEAREEYEFCNCIKKMIKIEKQELKLTFQEYFTYTKEDVKTINKMLISAKAKFFN